MQVHFHFRLKISLEDIQRICKLFRGYKYIKIKIINCRYRYSHIFRLFKKNLFIIRLLSVLKFCILTQSNACDLFTQYVFYGLLSVIQRGISYISKSRVSIVRTRNKQLIVESEKLNYLYVSHRLKGRKDQHKGQSEQQNI